jgi:hypothetical protein
MWELAGVAGLSTSKCPYKGIKANAEYKTLTGCSVVPTETDGTNGDGTYCTHWDDSCLKNELMTGFLNEGSSATNPLSRITIATLDDLGYSVDYSKADSYTRSNVKSSCLCNNNRSLMTSNTTTGTSTIQQHHSLRARDGSSTIISSSSSSSSSRRKLSQEGHAMATEYGQSILQERQQQRVAEKIKKKNMKQQRSSSNDKNIFRFSDASNVRVPQHNENNDDDDDENNSNVLYVGDKGVIVFIEENGIYYDVLITPPSIL